MGQKTGKIAGHRKRLYGKGSSASRHQDPRRVEHGRESFRSEGKADKETKDKRTKDKARKGIQEQRVLCTIERDIKELCRCCSRTHRYIA